MTDLCARLYDLLLCPDFGRGGPNNSDEWSDGMKATATTIIISRHLAISPLVGAPRSFFIHPRKVLNDNTVKAPANQRARSVTSKSASPKAEIEPLYSPSMQHCPSLFHACPTEVSSIA